MWEERHCHRHCLKPGGQRGGLVPSTSLPGAESGQRSLDKKAWGVRAQDPTEEGREGQEGQTGNAWNSRQEVPGTADRKCLEQQTGSAWND